MKTNRVGAGRRAGSRSTTASHFADEKMEAQRQEVTCLLAQSWEGGAGREGWGSKAVVPRPCHPGQAAGPQVASRTLGGSSHRFWVPPFPSLPLTVHAPTFGRPEPREGVRSLT